MAKDTGKQGKKGSWQGDEKGTKHPDTVKELTGENTYPEFSDEANHKQSRSNKK